MQASDIYVHLDDVEYSKNSFHNRNRIKGAQGALLLTVPVRYGGNSKTFISDIDIVYKQNWAKKHIKTIEQNYRAAPYYRDIFPNIESILKKEHRSLADLNISIIDFFKSYLGIRTPCYRSSELEVAGKGNEKLVNICKILGADTFIVKPGTDNYHPREYFLGCGIDFHYFEYPSEDYPQLHGSFDKHLSILDYAMNCGPNSF